MESVDTYVRVYNDLTRIEGPTSNGADEFRIDRKFLDICGYDDTKSVLDYGCGWGSLLTVITPNTYIGFDISPEILQEARIRNPKYIFEQAYPGKLSTTPVDVIVAHSVFTHIPKVFVNDCLMDVNRNLKINGFAIIDIIHGQTDMDLFVSYYEKEWKETCARAGLVAEYLSDRARNEYIIHSYYKITCQL